MTKKIIIALSCLATIAGLWSCVKNPVDRGSVKSAIQVVTSDLGTTWVTVALEPYGEAVSSYVVVDPVPASTIPYLDMDAVQKLNYLNEHGVQVQAPYRKSFTGFKPGETYVIGYLGKKADGAVCTAPTFSSFEMGTAKAECALTMAKESDTSYVYNYSIKKNEFAAKYKYIFSLDKEVTALTPEELEAKVKAEGTETTNDLSSEFKSKDWVAGVIGAVAYDKNGLIGEFTMKSVEGKDVQEVIVEVPASQTWEVTQKLPAKGEIRFKINGEFYGYRKMTGNGGLGTVPLDQNGFCAFPIANLQGLRTPYSVNCSMGYLEKLPSDNGKELWTRMDKERDVRIKLDMTDPDNILYFIQIVPDEGVYLDYDCSLLYCGGYYRVGKVNGPAYNGIKPQDPRSVTGLEPLTPDTCGYTDVGTDVMNTPDVACVDKEYPINDTYLANKLLTGWSFKRISEKGNGFRFGRNDTKHVDCFIETPAISDIPAGTDLYVDVRVNRYGTGQNGNVCLSVEGSGQITAAQYWTDKNPTPVDGASKISSGIFTIDTDVAPVVDNADIDKPQTTVRLTVTGAGPSTRIKMYVPEDVQVTAARMGFHGIKIIKK